MEYIIYVSGGLLGDFIHQLSIIHEIYKKTRKKGKLYISSKYGDMFKYDIEKTYNDLYPIVIEQEYIHSFEIDNQSILFDINLSSWRKNNINREWIEIYKNEYLVEWGSTPWIKLKENSTFKDCILIGHSICTASNRTNPWLKYSNLLKHENTYFITGNIDEYNYFLSLVKQPVKLLYAENLYEMIQIIHGCKVFIGNLSSPLASAMAGHIPTIGILPNSIDNIRVVKNFPNFKFYLNDEYNTINLNEDWNL
jgi:hypothetical protein